MISDGTASEEERLGALGDLQLALRRLDRGGDVLVAATDKLLAFELAEPCASRASARRGHPVRAHAGPRRLAGRHGRAPGRRRRISTSRRSPSGPSRTSPLAVYVLSDDGGNRDAPGHFLSWLVRLRHRRGAYDVGTAESYAEAQRAFRAIRDGSPAGSTRPLARDFGSSFRLGLRRRTPAAERQN